VTGAAAVSNVRAGTRSHAQGALGEVSSGFLGTIKVHASGRCVLHLGPDSQYELTPGAHCSFAQHAVVVRPGAHPISEVGLRAKAEALRNAEAAAAATFTAAFASTSSSSAAAGAFPDFDLDNEDSDANGLHGDMGHAQTAQAAAAAEAATKVRVAAQQDDDAKPKTYTVLGPVTRRVVAIPVLPSVLPADEAGMPTEEAQAMED
jgi:hypothetical protein